MSNGCFIPTFFKAQFFERAVMTNQGNASSPAGSKPAPKSSPRKGATKGKGKGAKGKGSTRGR